MHVLFVHGMGRYSVSGWQMLWHLRRAGLKTSTFGYSATTATFNNISLRLAAKIGKILETEELVLVGHSLGGVLLRDAISSLPNDSKMPLHLFLLGSPIQPSRLAKKLASNIFYRSITRDCGQLLGSVQRMAAIEPALIATTSIVGIRGLKGRFSPFKDEANDGVVSVSEVSAEWIWDQVQVPIMHTFLPASKHVANIILQRTNQHQT